MRWTIKIISQEWRRKLKLKKRKWKDNEIELVIDLYEANTCLWDIHSKDVKEKASSDMSDELDIPVEVLKQKWGSLRAQYGRELNEASTTHWAKHRYFWVAK